jgi:multidrug efflux pump subunit AcrB
LEHPAKTSIIIVFAALLGSLLVSISLTPMLMHMALPFMPFVTLVLFIAGSSAAITAKILCRRVAPAP